jgi:hypothetical protein
LSASSKTAKPGESVEEESSLFEEVENALMRVKLGLKLEKTQSLF